MNALRTPTPRPTSPPAIQPDRPGEESQERLLRADELARRLGVSVPTVRRWVRLKVLRRGVIVTTRPARTVRFLFSEILYDLSELQQRRRGRL